MTASRIVRSLQQFSEFVLQELANPFQTMRGTWIYRGHTDSRWDLAPQLFRANYTAWRQWHPAVSISEHESELVEAFRKAATAHLQIAPPDEWSWLALAQHHGLATRLLDWTFNPHVALYFAVRESQSDIDSIVWCYSHNGPTTRDVGDPYASSTIVFFEPRHVSPRIATQSGCFTSHPLRSDQQEWLGPLHSVVIPAEDRSSVRRELFRFGIHEQSLFPDLDGVARHTSWRYSTMPDEVRLHPGHVAAIPE